MENEGELRLKYLNYEGWIFWVEFPRKSETTEMEMTMIS